jgi:hypothetical protein
MDKIQNLVWQSGNMIADRIKANMSEVEKKYSEEYEKLINKYSRKQGLFECDLTKDYTPPKDLYIEVRALDSFSFKGASGQINKVELNQSYFFKRSEVEVFIRRGYFSINE